jgi:hypothetical protein
MLRLGIVASSVAKRIFDYFTRTTSGSLGTTTSGAVWNAIRGVWFANGSAGQSNDSASSYPIATVNFTQNANVSVSTSNGTGVSYWVTDSGSWWASYSYNASYSCNCQTCYACASCTKTYYSCGGYPEVYNSPQSVYACSAAYVGYICGQTYDAGKYYVIRCESFNFSYTNDCAECGSYAYSCNCQTCYAYYLRMLKSVGGAVSAATGDVSLGSAPAAISVNTSGDTITAKAWSDTAMTTQLGTTQTYTPTSPTKGTGVGIIKAPAENQGSTVDNFNASY